MPTLTVAATVTYGGVSPEVPARRPLNFSIEYTEQSEKIVQVPAASTDFPITLDTVTAPKFLLVEGVVLDVSIKLGDGTATLPSALAAGVGWIMFCNPNGQDVDRVLVTTPPAPASGARVKVTAFE